MVLVAARVGRVEETGDPLLPFRLVDGQGAEVPAVTEFLHHMLADDASPASLRSYAYELLAWFRFGTSAAGPCHTSGRSAPPAPPPEGDRNTPQRHRRPSRPHRPAGKAPTGPR